MHLLPSKFQKSQKKILTQHGQNQRGAFLRSIEKQRMREIKKLESLTFLVKPFKALISINWNFWLVFIIKKGFKYSLKIQSEVATYNQNQEITI